MRRQSGRFVTVVFPSLGSLAGWFATAEQLHAQAPLAEPLRRAAADEVVVTASRREQTLGSVSASIEVVDQRMLDQTAGYFVTDLLKKNSSVDVIQYPGGLSGVGLRGFRPQFSGVNQRVLVLVDGRPAGATSMGNIVRAGLERVEVVKGSASAIYGPSAMGGVVNYITRRSEGEIGGNFNVGYSSWDTMRVGADVGGSIGERGSFDLGFTHNEQGDDYRIGEGGSTFGTFVQGHGVVRPNTAFEQRSYFARGATRLGERWQAQLRLFVYSAPSTETPGAESDGVNNQGDKRDRNVATEASFSADFEQHALLAVAYTTNEESDTIDKPPETVPFTSFSRDTNFQGLQIQDTWSLGGRHDLILGLDYGFAESEARSYDASGKRIGAFSPNFERLNKGLFADFTAHWLDERLIVNFGARYDEIESRVLATPLRDDITPGTATFRTVNPRAGVVFRPSGSSALRIHASAGTGFIAPEANQIAGYSEQLVGGQLRVTRGNTGLEPEESLSVDVGIGYQGRRFDFDVTYFNLEVDQRIESVITTNTAELRETTYLNAQGSTAEGLEVQAGFDLGAMLGAPADRWNASLSATHYFTREQELASGIEPLRNVAKRKVNFSFGYERERFGVRLSGRRFEGLWDSDFSVGRLFTDGRGGDYQYPGFLVYDATAHWSIADGRQLSMQIDNLRDDYYFEKGDYPLPGRAVHMSYKHSF